MGVVSSYLSFFIYGLWKAVMVGQDLYKQIPTFIFSKFTNRCHLCTCSSVF